MKRSALSGFLGKTSWSTKNEKTNVTTWPNMLKSTFSKSNNKKEIKSIWDVIKPIFINRGIKTNEHYFSKKKRVLKNNRKERVSNFNFINIVEATSGKQPFSIDNPNSQCKVRATIKNSLNFTKTIPVL